MYCTEEKDHSTYASQTVSDPSGSFPSRHGELTPRSAWRGSLSKHSRVIIAPLFLTQACKRGNSDIVRLVIECGADCNILSKHQNSALHFAKQCNNVLVYDLLKHHLET